MCWITDGMIRIRSSLICSMKEDGFPIASMRVKQIL